ncbi:MAG: helicase HerA domain-containing protein [Vampirovibrionales bacterium]
MIAIEEYSQDAVLKIGEVVAVEGQRITVRVDSNKNSTELFYNGSILKNVSVNGYIEIKKGFTSLIGRVEGEKIDQDPLVDESKPYQEQNKNRRFLTVSLVGFIDPKGKFIGGLKELPLIANEAYLLTLEKLEIIHNLISDEKPHIIIATNDHDDLPIRLPINGLFNSHIAIFGNTGSGKSNTLAALYQAFFKELNQSNNHKFVFIDFNGEYTLNNCITQNKRTYNLSTKDTQGDKLSLGQQDFFDIEVLSILASATEQTQKPFLKRAIIYYLSVMNNTDPLNYTKNIIKKHTKAVLRSSDKSPAWEMIDYLKQILPDHEEDTFRFLPNSQQVAPNNGYFNSDTDIEATNLYKSIDNFKLSEHMMENFICFIYLQLISDVLQSRAKNEHIAPVINRLKSKKEDIEKIFSLETSTQINPIFQNNSVIAISLDKVNLDMKKMIPLLLCKKLYNEHKNNIDRGEGTLTFIIDEAHNILSTESFREAESWRDYRLETFEEIIKEGRKFGVFVTIASQRPSDISETITSQAHNYFIHRLINQRDLAMISKAVSYIDKITESSIPTLSTGTCIFSGIATQIPLKLNVNELPDLQKPQSKTFEFFNQ